MDIEQQYSKYFVGTQRIADLPKDYQTAIRVYAHNYDCFRFDKNALVQLYEVPIDVLKADIFNMLRHANFSSFEDYHESYKSLHELKGHETIWPIFLDRDFGCIIEDGWNRFHSYVDEGYEYIPCILT